VHRRLETELISANSTIYRTPLVLLLPALPVRAQIAVFRNDATGILWMVRVMVANAPPDTVTFIDLSVRPPKIVAELQAPSSWSGPPQTLSSR
jgi:hypothetical protein